MSKMWNCIICYTNEWGIYVSTVIWFSGILASSLFNACRVYLSIVLIKYGLSERWKNTSQIVEIISGHKTFRGNSMEHDNVSWKHWNLKQDSSNYYFTVSDCHPLTSISEFKLRFLPWSVLIFMNDPAIGIFILRVFIQSLHVGMSWSGVKIVIALLHVFPMVTWQICIT